MPRFTLMPGGYVVVWQNESPIIQTPSQTIETIILKRWHKAQPRTTKLISESLKHLRRNVKELLEFVSGGGLKAGYIAAEVIGVENFPHRCLKAREFGSKL